MDSKSTLYGGNPRAATIAALKFGPDHKLRTSVFVSDPSKLSWADGFAISGGDLYIADSRLWEVAFKNNRPRSGPFAIYKAKLSEQAVGRDWRSVIRRHARQQRQCVGWLSESAKPTTPRLLRKRGYFPAYRRITLR